MRKRVILKLCQHLLLLLKALCTSFVVDYDVSRLPIFHSGHAAYAAAVDLYPNNTGVGATYFMTYHTILKESSDYIEALKMARILAKNISQSMDHKVFAYR